MLAGHIGIVKVQLWLHSVFLYSNFLHNRAGQEAWMMRRHVLELHMLPVFDSCSG